MANTNNGDMPIDFYSWGEQTETGRLVTRNEQMHDHVREAFKSIEVKEDEETPELDYVLSVKGNEQGRIVIPYDNSLISAFYKKDTKDLILQVRIDEEGHTRTIHCDMTDLVNIYFGDNATINVDQNTRIVSITQSVMDKFDIEKNARIAADNVLSQKIADEAETRSNDDTAIINNLNTEVVNRQNGDNALDLKKQDKLIPGNLIEITENNVINFTGDLSLYILTLALPESGLPNKIYLVPSHASLEESNKCSEYAWVDNAWEKIGEISGIDLSQYVKLEWFNAQNYATEGYVNGVASGKSNIGHTHQISEINNLQGTIDALKARIAALETMFNSISTASEEDMDTNEPTLFSSSVKPTEQTVNVTNVAEEIEQPIVEEAEVKEETSFWNKLSKIF